MIRKIAIEVLRRADVDGRPAATFILPDNLSPLEIKGIVEAVLEDLQLPKHEIVLSEPGV